MATTIILKDLTDIRSIDSQRQATILGRGVASSFLFRSSPSARGATPVFNLNVDNLEVYNYEINNYIDKLISQTNNQLQLSMINVEAGDAAAINIISDQGLSGSNNSSL